MYFSITHIYSSVFEERILHTLYTFKEPIPSNTFPFPDPEILYFVKDCVP
jgi:hypothetical protein